MTLFLGEKTINESAMVLRNENTARSTAFLVAVTESIRNQILVGNLTSARNGLMRLRKQGLFLDYKIKKHGQIVDSSSNRNGESLKISVPIHFSEGGPKWGWIEYSISLNELDKHQSRLTYGFAKSLAVTFIILGVMLIIGYFYIWKATNQLASLLEYSMIHGSDPKVSSFFLRTWSPIIRVLNEVSIRMRKWHDQTLEIKKTEELNTVFRQVAHDIRSPLSALNLITSRLTEVPEDRRLVVRNAVNRINDIANQLLAKGNMLPEVDMKFDPNPSQEKSTNRMTENKLSPLLLVPIIDQIVSEKRVLLRGQKNAEIQSDFSRAYGLFVNVEPSELKRVISNLVNNSIEAMGDYAFSEMGNVSIAIRGYSDKINILVQDNGKGIPVEVLVNLGRRGVTHGKAGTLSGSGLGVYHAKRTIEAAGGQFDIASEVGVGTTVSISLPRAQSPSWFVEEINLKPNMRLISLDDDMSIHGIWRERIQLLGENGSDLQLMSFTSGVQFNNWVQSEKSDLDLFLVDYELLNQDRSGLDLIEELSLAKQSILVTSRFEEFQVRSRCEKLGIGLIPKMMAGLVPISMQNVN